MLLVKEEKPIDDVAAEESSGKTLMELLELEMRARAIKALLKKEEEGSTMVYLTINSTESSGMITNLGQRFQHGQN